MVQDQRVRNDEMKGSYTCCPRLIRSTLTTYSKKRFTNEDHLAVHKHKHEMTLKFGPARNDSVIVADQTPTPTRFLKNCEEVGLFNELASPFENEFKKASEDDIKKMPLDLSPLATPIIRNKIEEPSVVETTHQDSPLPHPESTTNDEKYQSEKLLQLNVVLMSDCRDKLSKDEGAAWSMLLLNVACRS
ncbi:hypothetical protein CIB84_008835 [Bambusicola thoracicus]|uniref:Uncharacterized protein n=1 Tax=Bambusicola thoracicus TaxID=9083 RepID=A0A2P4STG4_BAMTH|nr:hypothetical protein CIB84_008835 [Bambusicola thoracicus]